MSRAALLLYLASLALLPWSTFPPFPFLHVHAQWSDALFALAAAAWALDRWRSGVRVRLRLVHAGMALYLGGAVASQVAAGPPPAGENWKLLGMAELVALAVVTSDFATRPGVPASMARITAATALATAAAAVAGVALFLLGVPTPFAGSYGDLVPGAYARAQAGLYHPNLLASFCVFASCVVARRDADLPPWLVRLTRAALGITVVLTFSRGILAFVLAALILGARGRLGRLLAATHAAVSVALVVGLTVCNVSIDPTRPWAARLDRSPSVRRQALTSSLETLAAHPLLGTGPGTSPGRAHGTPVDAHLTPLNVAATLGLPGLAGFAAIPAVLWRRRRPTDRATWAALAGMALDALAQDVEDFRHLWILFGLADARSAATDRLDPLARST